MQIRQATESDYSQVMRLYNGLVGNDRYSRQDNDSFGQVIKNPRNFIYVAEENDTLIGFASFSIRDVIRYPKPIAELDELFIDPTERKKGIGKKLMQAIEEKAKELNCYRVFIESQYQHKDGHAFYEALGYTNYGYHFIKNL
jgi:(aminoalkyl)phosphonate N-acetyltransferase